MDVMQDIDGHSSSFVNVSQLIAHLSCTYQLKWLVEYVARAL